MRGSWSWRVGKFWVVLAATVLAGCANNSKSISSTAYSIPANASKGEQLAMKQDVLAITRARLGLHITRREEFSEDYGRDAGPGTNEEIKRAYTHFVSENGEAIIASYGRAYEQLLTTEEIDAAIRFLGTPEGQRYQSLMPGFIISESRVMQDLTPKLVEIISEETSR